MVMKIGFLNNQIDNRGTGNAVFNYAKYNKEILGNESLIFTFPGNQHAPNAIDKFVNTFGALYSAESTENLQQLDILYHIKSGEDDGFRPPSNVKYVPHAVFHPKPHGDDYFVISKWMSQKFHLPYIPHIVETFDTSENLREGFGIPLDATVLGRYGGPDTFDLPFVWEAIEKILAIRDDIWFIFAGTNPHLVHDRVIYIANNVQPEFTARFINTCDAMIHARQRGESFGISVGEFSSRNKLILSYKKSGERAHLHELKGSALTYTDVDDVYLLFFGLYRGNYQGKRAHPFYIEYTPEHVMHMFKQSVINGHYYYENPRDYAESAFRGNVLERSNTG